MAASEQAFKKKALAKCATVGPQKVTAMMTPAALNAGDRIFVLDKDHLPA
jgi:hypothetical protein